MAAYATADGAGTARPAVPVFSTLTQRLVALAKIAMGQVQNAEQVALEAGNNPKIIFSNYRELGKLADAGKCISLLLVRPVTVIVAPVATFA